MSAFKTGIQESYPEPNVRVQPACRTLITADSNYRKHGIGEELSSVEEKDSPYNFQVNLNAAITGKEIIYQRLYWNQPLFSHNNGNSELRFQINGDSSVTYVVYATPFLCYTQFDGNPAGSSFLPPVVYSYADNMEKGLNGDVRNLNSNLIPINSGTGILKDANGFAMTVEFRYSPCRGFIITFKPSINVNIPVYTIRLLECAYISEAHYVHGFGIKPRDSDSPFKFVPRDVWTVAYYSDDTPTLLPSRYIAIYSDELTKDASIATFQNSTDKKARNELAVFPLQCAYTCCYHSEQAGEDGSVYSKRNFYQPQIFRIFMTNEDGDIIQCDDPIKNLITNRDINYLIKASFIKGSLVNRGDPAFTNLLLFGDGFDRLLGTPQARFSLMWIPCGNPPSPSLGMLNYQRTVGAKNYLSNKNPFSVLSNYPDSSNVDIQFHCWSFQFSDLSNATGSGISNSVNTESTAQANFLPAFTPPATLQPQYGNIVNLEINPLINKAIGVSFDAEFEVVALDGGTPPPVIYFMVAIRNQDFYANQWIAAAYCSRSLYYINAPTVGKKVQFKSTDTPIRLQCSSNYSSFISPLKACIVCVIPIVWDSSPGNGNNFFSLKMNQPSWGTNELILYNLNTDNIAKLSNQYVEPVYAGTDQYAFGNPQADGLCEDLIHELASISDYS